MRAASAVRQEREMPSGAAITNPTRKRGAAPRDARLRRRGCKPFVSSEWLSNRRSAWRRARESDCREVDEALIDVGGQEPHLDAIADVEPGRPLDHTAFDRRP